MGLRKFHSGGLNHLLQDAIQFFGLLIFRREFLALIQMEAANQRDEQHAENLKIKQALLEQKGGHVDASIPCGVVLLERPCTSMDEWQRDVESATKEEAAQSKVVGE